MAGGVAARLLARVCPLVVLVALLASGLSTPVRPAAAQVALGATLSVLAPVVEVAVGGAPFTAARDGQTVRAGDQVRTGPTGVALLTFFDGSQTQLTSDSVAQIDAATAGNPISVLQSIGTSVSRVVAPSPNGFQTDTPPATALVRGTTYVVTTQPLQPPVTSVVLLADPDGRVGRVGVIGKTGGGTVELTNACDVGASALQTSLGTLDPATCAQLQASVLNLRDPTAAATTKQLGEQVNSNAAPGASQPGGGTPPPPPSPPPPPPPPAPGSSPSGGASPVGDPSAAAPPQSASDDDAATSDDTLALRSLAPPRVVSSSTERTRFGIAEGYRNPAALAESGATWERVVISWRAVQPNAPDDFSNLGKTLPADELRTELGRGMKVTALLQFTPAWAATNPDQGERSPPKNLDLPVDDPRNYWARFVYETVKFYAGQIDEFIIWNEPEFRPGDPGAGGSYTWLGTDEQFLRMLKVAYLSAKRANPNAVVVFPGTSYWVEQNLNRPQFYQRMLELMRTDPDAASNHDYHDVVALNLYRNPDDILRVYTVFKAIQRRFGLDVPIWLTETNAMPTDDRSMAPCDHAADSIPTTMEQQAAFAIQAFAIAAASGYARAGFYQMIDDNACMQPAVWGAVRDTGSRRPVFDALRTAMKSLADSSRARFVPIMRADARWPVWPDDPASYWPNWQVYAAVFDLPGGRRLTVLWNGDGQPQCIRVPHSAGAQILDKHGTAQPATDTITLAPATAHFVDDPVGYYFIGGDPQLLLEQGGDGALPSICAA